MSYKMDTVISTHNQRCINVPIHSASIVSRNFASIDQQTKIMPTKLLKGTFNHPMNEPWKYSTFLLHYCFTQQKQHNKVQNSEGFAMKFDTESRMMMALFAREFSSHYEAAFAALANGESSISSSYLFP
uniref:Uncharacterized protein n=1 Tax=Opuntia streptacantha TaxID=393608 RepID=A0A7C9EIX8_OPUST